MANTIAVTPDSTIRLLKCPIKLDDHNQFTFNNVTDQTNYFKSLTYLESNNLTYIRKDNVIRVDTSGNTDYEDLLQYNYCMYKNTHYDSKWFYAYITDIEYKNDGCTEISIETDVFQTWYFEVTWQNSFIEREHVADDTLGKHTVPENLELGEYVCNGYDYTSVHDQVAYVLLATTNTQGSATRLATIINGIPSPGYAYVFSSTTNLAQTITAFASGGYADNIYAVYMCSQGAFGASAPIPSGGGGMWDGSTSATLYTSGFTPSKPTTVNSYTPKNKKLLTFPYCYLLVSNNNGQSNVLHYERFKSSATQCEFELLFNATVGGDSKLVPVSYDISTGHSEINGLSGGKYPTLAWSKDLYTNWLSQNAVNLGIGQATSVLSIVAGTALLASGAGTLAGAGLITAGVSGITNSMMTQYQHSFDPHSAQGNVNNGNINVSGQTNGFYAYDMSIKSEYAQMIDNYFEHFGYKVNRMGTPNLKSRTYWNYCKTIDAHLSGNIPNQDMIKLKELFNNGCTFWHNTSYFMDYSRTNSIVT